VTVPAAATERGSQPRGSAAQRLRAAAVAGASWLAARLPESVLHALAVVLGAVWYRITPARAELARRNLARVARYLAAQGGAGDPRLGAAARDPRALEALVRSAYRHAVSYYLDMIRLPAIGERELLGRLDIETPDVIDRAFSADRPAVFVGLHFGAIELPAMYLARRAGRTMTVPMETLSDPALQAWVLRTRSRAGLRIVGLGEARRVLQAALDRGESVGLVGDRDLTGNGIAVPFFGVPARLPAGPALLAIESGAPLFVGAVRRVPGGRWRGQLGEVPGPPEGPRRDRVVALLEGTARAFERSVAAAPDQWWTVFHRIWDDEPGDQR
jgi:KDO2-lipid IV(A) lauroyltransferase